MIRGTQQLIDGLAILRVDRCAGTYRDRWLVAIAAQSLGNSIGNTQSGMGFRLRKNEHEFVTTITRSGVNCAAMNPKSVCQAADGLGSREMTMVSLIFFRPSKSSSTTANGRPVRPYLLISESSVSRSRR